MLCPTCTGLACRWSPTTIYHRPFPLLEGEKPKLDLNHHKGTSKLIQLFHELTFLCSSSLYFLLEKCWEFKGIENRIFLTNGKDFGSFGSLLTFDFPIMET
jgi:hypothetical protein